MAPMFLACLATTVVLSVTAQMRNDDFPFYDLGTIPAWKDLGYLRGTKHAKPFDKEAYHSDLKHLDIPRLYESITKLMVSSKAFWPADGPQDGDIPSYAGLFGRLAWHCSGTFRLVNDTHAAGGCEGARQRHWPENEWRDNTNLDKARGLLGQVKQEFGANISWSDLITFAGTVALKASGGPKTLRFCFGRSDDVDGAKSIPLGVEGVHQCRGSRFCKSNFECPTAFHWPEQNEKDHARCNLTQPDNRLQASHSVGLIYVYPEGPELSPKAKGYKPEQVHQRSPRLSALEVRDTFHRRMGWTDRETVALIGGGHTLGRTHGNCNLTGTQWGKGTPYNDVGPYFEASPGTLRGPTDGTCGHGAAAGRGANTVSSGFEGPWTRTPSRWNYDFFHAMLAEEWEPAKSPFGNDQWRTKDRKSKYAKTMRLTADLALVHDETYAAIVKEYASDYAKFDADFADAWYKLMHRSQAHPKEEDLRKEVGVCTNFEFVK